MRLRLRKRFNAYDQKSFQELYSRLKVIPCPHCQSIGQLILHGYLRGYDERNANKQIIRGRRIFCSNRQRRAGCGRTVSIFITTIIKHITITTKSLWVFLNNILTGKNKFQAFRKTGLSFSNTTVYRIYQKVFYRQYQLRALLLQSSAIPEKILSSNPLIKTLAHLKSVFANSADPLAAFQSRFQVSFL